jgi:lipoprotein signal peptidase
MDYSFVLERYGMKSQPKRSFLWLFWTLTVLGLVLDQASKYAIFAALYHNDHGEVRGDTFSLIPGAFQLSTQYTRQPVPDDWLRPLRSISADHMPCVNHGALFGLGDRDRDGNDGNLFFSLISLAAAIAIVLWVLCSSAGRDGLLCVSLGLILAGTLGNFYDRLVFDGVRDFLHWYYLVNWPVFNLADCCLVCGASLLLFQALFLQPKPVEQPAPAAAEKAPAPEVANVK